MLDLNQRPKDYESALKSREIIHLGRFLFRKFARIASRRPSIGAGLHFFAEQFSSAKTMRSGTAESLFETSVSSTWANADGMSRRPAWPTLSYGFRANLISKATASVRPILLKNSVDVLAA